MKISLKRVFHPVGQGAFYSEQIYSGNNVFEMVFDCGNAPEHNEESTIKADSKLSKYFKCRTQNNDWKIDLLFISHFHADHISFLIKYRRKYQVKNLIIPLLTPQEINLLLLGVALKEYQIDIKAYHELLTNPEKFFGEDCHIIKINSDKSNESNLLKTFNPIFKLQYTDNKLIIYHPDPQSHYYFPIWLYIPYDFIKYFCRLDYNRKISTFFTKTKLTSELLMDVKDITEILKHIEKKLKNIEKKLKNKNKNKNKIINIKPLNYLKAQYMKFNRDLNKICLGVFSGPVPFHLYSYLRNLDLKEYNKIFKEQSCLYTGDIPFNATKEINCVEEIRKLIIKSYASLSKLYSESEDYDFENNFDWHIGTLQIPHHGSGSNYSDDFFKLKFINAVICFGSNNGYDHPDEILKEKLLDKEKIIKEVSDYYKTKFKQKFEINN
ncbi:hypothetical protein B6D23_09370 [Gilliamella sp. N-W3]|uniref:MBL fold metallo-hydrolase n=2 Tax=unclassified Gilliamella TaxID=2685620 RepID=UPI000A33F974|nr:MBL fold metallo-hydrolase [Gilliamella sp. N-W3]OTQ78246.1 hypothetical protein B6D23_09370 [Gilliamella sp. N-W3]